LVVSNSDSSSGKSLNSGSKRIFSLTISYKGDPRYERKLNQNVSEAVYKNPRTEKRREREREGQEGDLIT
jgi:hypothetical protein